MNSWRKIIINLLWAFVFLVMIIFVLKNYNEESEIPLNQDKLVIIQEIFLKIDKLSYLFDKPLKWQELEVFSKKNQQNKDYLVTNFFNNIQSSDTSFSDIISGIYFQNLWQKLKDSMLDESWSQLENNV